MAIFQMHVGVQDMSFGVTFFHVTRLANCESEKARAPEEGAGPRGPQEDHGDATRRLEDRER